MIVVALSTNFRVSGRQSRVTEGPGHLHLTSPDSPGLVTFDITSSMTSLPTSALLVIHVTPRSPLPITSWSLDSDPKIYMSYEDSTRGTCIA